MHAQSTVSRSGSAESADFEPTAEASLSFIDPSGANLAEVRRLVHRVVDMVLTARASAALRPPVPASFELPIDPEFSSSPRTEDALLRDLQAMIGASVTPSHPNFLAHMGAVSSVMSPLGDFVAACLNNNMIGLELSPCLSLLEQAVGRQLASCFGLGARAGGVLTTGGSLSNLHALVVARNAIHGTLEQGLHALEGPAVFFASEAAHASVTKTAMIAGLGSVGAVAIRTTPNGGMDMDDLRRKHGEAKETGKQPFAVVATAGTTVTGSIDPIPEIGAFAREHGLWFHVDAAWGGGLQFSACLRTRLRGIEVADSVTFCPQKLLLVGLSSSMVMFRDMEAMKENFRTSFPYVRQQEGFTNFSEIGVQGSRPAEILKLWLTLQHVGIRRFGEMIENWMRLADEIAEQVTRRSYLCTACQPQSGIVCFQGRPSWVGEGQWDSWNAGLHDTIARRAGIYLSLVPYRGTRWLRAVFANPFTDGAAIERLFSVIDEYAIESGAKPRAATCGNREVP